MFFYTLFGGYVLTSLLLFKYPTLMHKKKKIKFICQHISHRGGAGENYENTMYAFKRSAAIGTEMLELDCHLTKDGQVVVSHDQNLLRTTGVNVNISEIDFKDLPLLKTRIPIDFDPGVEFHGSDNINERKIALLQEVFDTFPKMPINIDIKVNNDDLIRKVSELIKLYNREELTVWGNFSDVVTKKCYDMNPNVNLFFAMKRVVLLIILMYTGLLPFVPIRETHLEIFLPCIYARKKGYQVPTFLPVDKLFLGCMNVLLIRPCLFNHLKARGIHVYLWVLNSDEDFKTAFDLGVTGVMTDYPTKLKLFLARNTIK
ncbi:lysophospholipase D GDPD1-like [Phymastichus coffea]|uniref:lysophospholipase D GDPD1-like n=1 Tax=Phymastichus coffea TaxID=108790 RepID=UPI00273AC206|nr:lysophospholipase D GDPD1-like [Phymastichus coffea]